MADVQREAQKETGAGLSRWKIVLITLAMCLGAVTVGIDAAIIAPSVPFFAEEWHAFKDIGWFGVAYILPQITLQSFYGRLLYFVNAKWSYLAGIFGLQAGSLICTLSQSAGMLIAGRAVTGVSVAMLMPAGMAICGHIISKPRRPLFIACIFASMGLATFGCVLGGFFANASRWRWMFMLNFPVGATVGGLMLWLLPRWAPPGATDATKTSWRDRIAYLDLPGCALLLSALTCLCLALHFVASELSWTAPTFLGCMAGFAVLTAGFVCWQVFGSGENRLISRSIFSNKTSWIVSLLAMLINVGVAAHIFLLPSYYQIVRQESSTDSGLKLVPYLILGSVGTVLSGIGLNKLGYANPFVLFGLATFLVGAILLDRIDETMPTGLIVGIQVVCGLGCGLVQIMPVTVIQQSLDDDDQLEGTTLVAMWQLLGSAIGISLGTTILSQTLYDQLTADGVPSDITALVLEGVGTTALLQQNVSFQTFEVIAQAFALSIQQAYKVSIVSGALALFIACFLPWKRLVIECPVSSSPQAVEEAREKPEASSDEE